MKRVLIFLAFLFCYTPSAVAQFTTVTATVKDQFNNPYNGGTIAAALQFPTGVIPKIGNTPVPTSSGPFVLSSTGVGSLSLADVLQVSPTGTSWLFTVCGNSIPWPGIASVKLCFNVGPLQITGGSEDISATINAAAPYLAYTPGNGGGGGAGNPGCSDQAVQLNVLGVFGCDPAGFTDAYSSGLLTYLGALGFTANSVQGTGTNNGTAQVGSNTATNPSEIDDYGGSGANNSQPANLCLFESGVNAKVCLYSASNGHLAAGVNALGAADTNAYVPSITALGLGTFNQTAQSSPVSPTLCANTVCGTGQFIISVSATSNNTCATPGPAAVSFNAVWTDEAGSHTFTIPLSGNNISSNTLLLGATGNFASGQLAIWSTGAASITATTTYTACTTGTGQYNVHFSVVEPQ